jgi:hypothetical protein
MKSIARTIAGLLAIALCVIAAPASAAGTTPPASHSCVSTDTYQGIYAMVCIDVSITQLSVDRYLYRTTTEFMCGNSVRHGYCTRVRALSQQYVSPLGWGVAHRFGCGVDEARSCSPDVSYDFGIASVVVGAGVHHEVSRIYNITIDIGSAGGIHFTMPEFRVDRYDRVG